jgi:signal recognition particle subunit SRP54
MGKQLENADIDDRAIDWTEAIILSMTPAERSKPDLINPSRKRRIAAGSGRSVEEVNRLIKQLKQMQKLMRQMNGKGKKRRGMRMPPMDGMPGGGFPNF